MKWKKPDKKSTAVLIILLWASLTLLVVVALFPAKTVLILHSYDIKDSPIVNKFAKKAVEYCYSDPLMNYSNYTLDMCIYAMVEKYIYKNIRYVKDVEGNESPLIGFVLNYINNDPVSTIKNKKGDCENMAILAIDMLKSLGKKNLYMIYQDKHVCWGIWDYGQLRTFNCVDNLPIIEILKVG